MALRVLLADESSTIKRVMQLALQDFGVEVKSVPIGIDVLPMTKSFKPDIVFADVLLQKKSGYDVCKEIKEDPITSQTPVVLMWSGFMELDEARAKDSQANQRIEKPFDAETLRQIVQNLVAKTKTNTVSQYLTFPKMPEFTEEPMSAGAPQPPPPLAPTNLTSPDDIFAIPEIGENDVGPATAEPQLEGLENVSADEFEEAPESWSHQDLGKIKTEANAPLDLSAVSSPKVEMPPAPVEGFEKFMIPGASDLGQVEVQSAGEFEEVTFIPTTQQTARTESTPGIKAPTALESAQAENIIREEARAMIESICWKILPDIAERVIREEINKLLKDAEKNI